MKRICANCNHWNPCLKACKLLRDICDHRNGMRYGWDTCVFHVFGVPKETWWDLFRHLEG